MKKFNIAIILFALFVLPLIGCESNNSRNIGDTTSTFSPNINAEAKMWPDAYAEFLIEFFESDNYYATEFSLRDLDENEIPELIILQFDNNQMTKLLTIYSYNSNVYKIGECDNPGPLGSAPRFSNNPMFPGLFLEWYGGGIERFGYLSVKAGKLISEDLWCIDRSKEPPQENEISDNKLLINESMDIFLLFESRDSILEMILIDEDNVDEIKKFSVTASNSELSNKMKELFNKIYGY